LAEHVAGIEEKKKNAQYIGGKDRMNETKKA
jgi:hypothetical protein